MDVKQFKDIIWNYTRKINESTNLIISSLSEHHDLTALQVRILVEIEQHGSHTIGSLANKLKIAGTNISTMCKKLENKGYLERVRDATDERVVKVALTEQGSLIVKEIDQELLEKISQSIDGEDEGSLQDIIVGLKKLNEILEKMDKL